MREDETFDARRGDGLGTEELARERLEVDERGWIVVQVSARFLRIRGRSGDA